MIDSTSSFTGINVSTSLHEEFKSDVLRGLGAPQRAIPARWLYDMRGSMLFEQITALPEYYPTRTERDILSSSMKEIVELTGKGRVVVEFGSGSSTKTRLLLNEAAATAYVPIDISGTFLREAVREVDRDFPTLTVEAVVGDFTKPLSLPHFCEMPRLGFFSGSTIGNLLAPAAVDLLRTMGSTLGENAQLLIGIDRIKSPGILVPAYNDDAGVTAQFNLHLLERINRELDGTIRVEHFRHVARWNDDEGRIEMHLEAVRATQFEVVGNRFAMEQGDTIHTENSIKYGTRDARLLLRAGGWRPLREWCDPDRLFAVVLAELATPSLAP